MVAGKSCRPVQRRDLFEATAMNTGSQSDRRSLARKQKSDAWRVIADAQKYALCGIEVPEVAVAEQRTQFMHAFGKISRSRSHDRSSSSSKPDLTSEHG